MVESISFGEEKSKNLEHRVGGWSGMENAQEQGV